MRTIFVLGILLICAFLAGWFTIDRDDEGTTIRINRDEIRGDARQAIEHGREFLDRDGQRVTSEQVAQQPNQPYGDNAPATYDPPVNQYQQQPPLDPRYQDSGYQPRTY